MTTETEQSRKLRLAAYEFGATVWRNNSGVAVNRDGRPVRFGLGNDSRALNNNLKSADLIGWTQAGVFVAIEVKRPGWTYRGTDRERAQKAFLDAVTRSGGLAGFATDRHDVAHILMRDGPPAHEKPARWQDPAGFKGLVQRRTNDT